MNIFLRYKSLLHNHLVWIVMLGFILRLYSSMMRGIINPDAVHYLYQAKAIFYHEWHSIIDCNLNYVSLFPILIATVYAFVRNWIAAGVLINLCFGTGVLIPLYFILRRFFNRSLTLATVLIYALLPAFVSGSGDLLRGPLFWFLICMGMLMFIRQWDTQVQERRFRFDLFLSCLFFLLASWTRIEGVVFIASSAFFICISKSDLKIQRFFIFLSPMIIAFMLVTALVLAHSSSASETSIFEILRINRVYTESVAFVQQFHYLQTSLKQITAEQGGLVAEFLKHAGNITWMMPINVIFIEILEGFFYVFALIYFCGWIGIRKKIKEDWRVGYFFWSSIVSFLAIYIHLLQTWLIYHRFLAIIFYPGCLFFGFGLSYLINFFTLKFKISSNKKLYGIVIFILLLTISKNLLPKEEDKRIYRNAAEIIAKNKSDNEISLIAARPTKAYHWIFFYAHRNYPGPLCEKKLRVMIPKKIEDFKTYLKTADVRYVIYEEQNWPKNTFDLLASVNKLNLQLVGQWLTDKNQKMLLFEVSH